MKVLHSGTLDVNAGRPAISTYLTLREQSDTRRQITRQKMTQYLSDKIKVLSLFSIILVLYIHSGFHDYPHEIQGMAFNFTLQEFISGKIGRCAVPLFFAISGYLFFRNIDIKAGRRECYGQLWTKMRKRCRTLVVPYVIACLFPVAFQLVLEQVPAARPFMNGGGFSENFSKTVSQLFYMIYIDSGNGSPYAFQLWFLRDLIVIVALSPIVLMIKMLWNRGGTTSLLFSSWSTR